MSWIRPMLNAAVPVSPKPISRAVGLAGLLCIFCSMSSALADTVTLSNGDTVEGIIRSIEGGRVTVEIDGEVQELDIRAIDSIDFNTPHLPQLLEPEDLEHFAGDLDAQDIVRHGRELRETAGEIDRMLEQVRSDWLSREPIRSEEEAEWDAIRERFRRPVARYQEVLSSLYFHVLAYVDEYNRLMTDAGDVYVGVQGLFQVGSPLVSKEMRQLPLRDYVPANWYDAIFYEGYYFGYEDAYQEFKPEP